MGLQQAEQMTQMIEAAQRLRMVRRAHRRFLMLWATNHLSMSDSAIERCVAVPGTEGHFSLHKRLIFDD
jgi:hypothetical protein